MSTPEYLYHYTNIETLALILKNHTIRFNSLDKMDDPQEQDSADINNLGKCFYISSWTDDITESIPMWKMYSSLETGIRIRLKSNPFAQYINSPNEITKKFTNGEEIPVNSFIPISEMAEKKFYCPQATIGDFLKKVHYSSNKEDLCPTIIKSHSDKKLTLALDRFGQYKNLHWQFQNEWRYIFMVIPLDITLEDKAADIEVSAKITDLLQGNATSPFSNYDLKLSDAAFADMEITLSPRITPGNKVIVESLVEKYNPSATIIESGLKNLI